MTKRMAMYHQQRPPQATPEIRLQTNQLAGVLITH